MKQPHPEVNFRLGRGRRRELCRAFSARSMVDVMRWVGMTDEEIRAGVLKEKPPQDDGGSAAEQAAAPKP